MESVKLQVEKQSRWGRIVYGAIFIFVLPIALVAWTYATRSIVHLPTLHQGLWGLALSVIGLGVMLAGMLSLWRYGGGLPMNAFPPPRFVRKGIYALIPHPIYVGFVLECAGIAIAAGSASGLWLVTPSVALGCGALVLGYEVSDLRRRFGVSSGSCWMSTDSADTPSPLERLRVYLVVLLPWLALFELFGAMGKPVGAITTYLPFELRWPVLQQTEVVYASTYLVVLIAPLFAKSRHALRFFVQRGLTAMALLFPLYLVLPFFVPPKLFAPVGWTGSLLQWERTSYSGIAAFPSFHVVWALIAAETLGVCRPQWRWLWWLWAVMVAVSCVTTGMHSMADVVAGAAAYVLIVRAEEIWKSILRVAETIANSWKEWRFGPVRVINHGAYAGLATLVGLALIDTLLGPGYAVLTASIYVCSTIGAALWAQWVEGSPALLRPLGFYGGMIGAMIGALPGLWMHVELWRAFAAICVAAPWIQGIGRLRCLVQGCCHGAIAESVPGISYRHPRTRVCRLAHLRGVPIHATQVYSIVWNAMIGLALLRLVFVHTSYTMICGVYCLLSGAGRFVEEAYRGEPQTKIFFGLRMYQWIAVFVFIAGAAITTVPVGGTLSMMSLRMSSLLIGGACGAIAWFVTGIDFPESSRRFARLT